jgi:outer membrane protein assembly factor BamB
MRVIKNGDSWITEEIRKNRDIRTYMSSPVLFDGLIVLFSGKRKGVYATLDPTTGQILWQSQGREGDNTALIRAGELLLSLQTDSRLIIAKRDGEKFKVIKEYAVADSPVWAPPAFFDKHVIVKDKKQPDDGADGVSDF